MLIAGISGRVRWIEPRSTMPDISKVLLSILNALDKSIDPDKLLNALVSNPKAFSSAEVSTVNRESESKSPLLSSPKASFVNTFVSRFASWS